MPVVWRRRDLARQLGLTPPKRHAAELAADALHRALGAAAKDGAVRIEPGSRRTLVAMSGGVDSAAAAQLALDAGDEVVAVTLELWSDPGTDGEKSCCSPQAVRGARDLAHRMGIPHVTLDLRERFRAEVVDRFLDGYAAGRTPNPCVRCNGEVRFDAMLELAEALGAARLATGHYARVARDEHGPLVRAAADPEEGPELHARQARSRRCSTASASRSAASPRTPCARSRARRGCPSPTSARARTSASSRVSAAAPSSSATAARRLRRPGEIVDRQGTVLGRHEGQHNYTVGQRRGLGLASREPLYVLEKDAGANRVVVGPKAALATTRVPVEDVTLHRPAGDVETVRLRYHSEPLACRVHVQDDGSIELELDQSRERSRTGAVGLPDASGSRRGRGNHRRAALTNHHERIDLVAPLSGDFQAVVRLIIGGIAERVDFAFEEIDDLQLAVERLLAEAGQVGSVRLSFEVGESSIRTRVGPLSETAVADALRDGEARPGQLTLRRILQTVVDSFGVEEVESGAIVVRLEKLKGLS